MAIARLSVKVGKAGKAAHHAAYIARMGRYASRLEKGERLVASEVGNMPAWAQGDPLSFWEAADAFERKNGSVYREMEIALPRELDAEQQIALVRDWVQQEIGNKHAYQWAIHAPKAADGKEQPHVHLLFSERTLDGIERGPDQFFKRYNAKEPERGGCKKANTGLDRETRREQLKSLRSRWEVVCNRALERAGQDARIDMRSYADQGVDLVPERKMLPSEWRQESRRAEIIEFRTARAERLAAQRDLRREVPDAGAEIIELQARRQEQEAQRKAAQQIGELLTSAEALLGTGKPAKAPKRPSPEMDALQELINADQRAGRRGVSVSRPEPAGAPEKAAAPVIPPKATEPSPTVPAPKQAPPPAPAQEPKKAPPEWLRRAKEEDQRRRASWERYERDRSTEQETRPGIRHPSKPRWQTEREAILAAKYGEDVASRLGKWYRIERQGDALVLKNAQATITDYGDRVTANAGNDKEIAAMVELARAKGWEKVSLTGSAEFQERAARAFVEAGFGLVDTQLERVAREAIEADRREAAKAEQERVRERAVREREAALVEQQARETRPGIRHADRSQWEADRALVLSRKYDNQQVERAEQRGFYCRWMEEEQGLFFERKKDGVRLVDQGPLIVVPQGERYREHAPEVYVLYAQARGWQSIDILGDEVFRLQGAKVALEEGLAVSDPDLTKRAEAAIEAERRRAPQPEVQTVPQPAQRPIPEPKVPSSSPLLAGEWKGSTQGSPRAGGPVIFTVKDNAASLYHDHQRVTALLEPVQTSKGPALRGTAHYSDGHSVTLVVDLSGRQGRGYEVWAAVKDRNGNIIEKQSGKMDPQQRMVARGLGKGHE